MDTLQHAAKRLQIRSSDPKRWLVTGGFLGAMLTASCCIAPFVLIMLGVSGAWISNLTALEPLKPYFAAVALAFIAAGYWHVYFRSKPQCVAGSYCSRPQSSAITKSALGVATTLVAVALTLDWWAPLFY